MSDTISLLWLCIGDYAKSISYQRQSNGTDISHKLSLKIMVKILWDFNVDRFWRLNIQTLLWETGKEKNILSLMFSYQLTWTLKWLKLTMWKNIPTFNSLKWCKKYLICIAPKNMNITPLYVINIWKIKRNINVNKSTSKTTWCQTLKKNLRILINNIKMHHNNSYKIEPVLFWNKFETIFVQRNWIFSFISPLLRLYTQIRSQCYCNYFLFAKQYIHGS